MKRSLQGTAILATDDDADSVVILACLLADEGAIVRTATSARETLETLRTWTPDVLLLDLSMPDMDGYGLLAAIRRQPALRAIPAVAVTGYSYERERLRSVVAGFAGHMTKPFDVTTLVRLIGTLAPKPRAA